MPNFQKARLDSKKALITYILFFIIHIHVSIYGEVTKCVNKNGTT